MRAVVEDRLLKNARTKKDTRMNRTSGKCIKMRRKVENVKGKETGNEEEENNAYHLERRRNRKDKGDGDD